MSLIRLECLKLAHTYAYPASQVMERAQLYEEYLNKADPKKLEQELNKSRQPISK